MRERRGVSIVLMAAGLLAWGGPLPRGSPRAAADDATTLRYDIAGVTVIHRYTPAREVVAVRLFLLGGTRQVTAATQGIEALLLTAAQRATRRELSRLGARSFVEAGLDWTAVGFVALPRDVAFAWDVFAGWLSSLPPDSAIAGARREFVSAAERRQAHPDARVWAMARAAAFPDHPYALEPWGTIESLSAISAADLEAYRTEQFVRSRLLLVVVGAVSRDEIESLVSGTLGRLPAGSYRWTLPPRPRRQPADWHVEHRVLPTNYIVAYYLGPSPTDDDYFAFQVATHLLSSGLHAAIRDELSLSYAPSAPFFDHALPAGGLYASTGNPVAVYHRMQQEVAALKDIDLHPFVVRDFLDQFSIERLSEQMTTAGQAEALGRAMLLFGDFHMADDAWEKLRRVGPTAVQFAANKYMRDFHLAYLGDTLLMLGKW